MITAIAIEMQNNFGKYFNLWGIQEEMGVWNI